MIKAHYESEVFSEMMCFFLYTKIYYMALNEFLKKSRESQRYTQDAAAKVIGDSTATIQNWENNRSKPDINILNTIADAYHVSIDELGRNLISELKKDGAEDSTKSIGSFKNWLRSFPDFPELSDLKGFQMSEDEVLAKLLDYGLYIQQPLEWYQSEDNSRVDSR